MSRPIADMLRAQDAPTVRPPPQTVTCPVCDGDGGGRITHEDGEHRPCWKCRGAGEVTR